VATVRVVIANDHDEVRQSIRQLLERTDGFAVVGEAVDGAQAVAEAGRLLPDLVIMDVFMPEMGGLEATRQVVKKWPLVKVVALTADPRMVMDALAAGATGCLLKGDPAPALVAVLRNVVSGARSAQSPVSTALRRSSARTWNPAAMRTMMARPTAASGVNHGRMPVDPV
jgi:DNA-binding NarL/FixJ family response regulator